MKYILLLTVMKVQKRKNSQKLLKNLMLLTAQGFLFYRGLTTSEVNDLLKTQQQQYKSFLKIQSQISFNQNKNSRFILLRMFTILKFKVYQNILNFPVSSLRTIRVNLIRLDTKVKAAILKVTKHSVFRIFNMVTIIEFQTEIY